MNNKTNSENIVIVGGGIPGIFSALYASKIYPECNIHLIEASNKIGGLYNSINNEKAGDFDKGMHIIYETCNDEIDSIIRNCLPDDEWIYLKGNKKDIAGNYYKGKLEINTPYLNINQVASNKKKECLADLLTSFNKNPKSFIDCLNAREYFESRFGNGLTEELFEPVIKKLWKKHSTLLHPSVTRINLMDRICIFSEEATNNLMKSEIIRSRIAYPNQMKLNLS